MKRSAASAIYMACLLLAVGCTVNEDPGSADGESAAPTSPMHTVAGRVLLTGPEKHVSADVQLGEVKGTLGVNAKDCFTVNSAVLVAEYDAYVLPDGMGVHIPNFGEVKIGETVSGAGGLSPQARAEYKKCMTARSKQAGGYMTLFNP